VERRGKLTTQSYVAFSMVVTSSWQIGNNSSSVPFILCVYNEHYKGWTLPGGKVKKGEIFEAAQDRILLEETGLLTIGRHLLYYGPIMTFDQVIDHVQAFVFRAWTTEGVLPEDPLVARRRLMTTTEFLTETPFSRFYKTMFLQMCPDCLTHRSIGCRCDQ
jgi:ADP-ribose pyrophosphatase YjhB (NUDIX family)